MDDTTNTNQNMQVQNLQVPPSSPLQQQVVNNPTSQVTQSNPFLDKLNLNKYDDLLADFEIKNPELALKAKKELESKQSNDQQVAPEAVNSIPNNIVPNNQISAQQIQQVQDVSQLQPVQQIQQVPLL